MRRSVPILLVATFVSVLMVEDWSMGHTALVIHVNYIMLVDKMYVN